MTTTTTKQKPITKSAMSIVDHLLVCLAEECAETAQRATKMLRFGPEEIQSGQALTNADRMVHEFNDICAVMVMLSEAGIVPEDFTRAPLIEAKKKRVEEMLGRSLGCGRLNIKERS